MGWTSPEAREMFEWFVKHEAERRSRDRQKVSEALQTVPASQETLDALGALSPEDAGRALRTHPGYLGERKVESVRTMLELFRRALADLAAALADFPELDGPDARTVREGLEKDISIRVNKELFAALGVAKTLVDYSRRIKDLVDANLYDSKLKETFHAGEQALIFGLRNSVHHSVHSKANWQKRWSAGIKTTHFVIQREELLAEGDLNSAAREHLDRLGTTCGVTELLRGYAQKVDLFYGWLLSEVESHLPLEIRDYRACRKAVKRQHGRLGYEFMIGLWTQASADPYQHLSKLLTSEQMKEMETLPHRSPEQVDYVIACLDKDGLCDDHLRAVVYKFFNVMLQVRNRKSLDSIC
jgi:hypothetical protein